MDRIHERLALLALLSPVTVANAAKTSAWVDVSECHELRATLLLGDMAAETIDFKIEQAQDGAGAGAKDVKASTQLAASAAANDNKVLVISATADKLDSAGGFKFARVRAITGGATGGMGAALLEGHMRRRPVDVNAAVLEVAIA